MGSLEKLDQYLRLFVHYLDGTITPKEEKALEAFFADPRYRDKISWMIEQWLTENDPDLNESDQLVVQQIAERVGISLKQAIKVGEEDKSFQERVRGRLNYLKYYGGIVAAMLLLVVGAWWLLSVKSDNESLESIATKRNLVTPGPQVAVLILPNGKTMQLASEMDGLINTDTSIRYADGTLLIGHEYAQVDQENDLYYQLSTPKGGEYQLTLSDGSRVHLSADSRLIYPAHFDESGRRVTLIGEAFFDVTKLEKDGVRTPFFVQARGKIVEVLGTSFNISAYQDEPTVKATLVTGKISMKSAGDSSGHVVLPGQEAIAVVGQPAITINNVDVEMATAWRNGEFVFGNRTLRDILRGLSRWYAVEIDYATVPQTRFQGSVFRTASLADILAILAKTGNLSFTMRNGKLGVNQLNGLPMENKNR